METSKIVQFQQKGDSRWWIGFHQTPHLGPKHIQALGDAFGWDLESAWNAPTAKLSAIVGERVGQLVEATRTTLDLDAIVTKVERLGQTVIPYADSRYPALLRETSAPPIVLYVEGELTEADGSSIAIVGSRASSPYGRDVAKVLATDLAAAGMTIVSGLARGIDGVAHDAALTTGGRTIAVLAGGLDWIYPSEHKALARRVTENGALISEHPPGTRPQPYNFPLRNRIMAGISLGVVIVEAKVKSGTLITAKYAVHYNRDVFAVPGSVLSHASDGCHQLIKEGACLVRDAGDILAELNIAACASAPVIEEEPLALTGTEGVVYAALTADPQHIDDLSVAVELTIADVATALMMLELQGLVRNTGAQYYARQR
jgi:DNA processing protein